MTPLRAILRPSPGLRGADRAATMSAMRDTAVSRYVRHLLDQGLPLDRATDHARHRFGVTAEEVAAILANDAKLARWRSKVRRAFRR